jgi:hypothetical protein
MSTLNTSSPRRHEDFPRSPVHIFIYQRGTEAICH